jgi:cytoskeletal protein CcmA (bactofilin family)
MGDEAETHPGSGQRMTNRKEQKNRKLLGRFWRHEKQALSLIGEGITVIGSMDFGNGEVRLEGRLEGKMLGQGTLIIGEQGSLQGEVDVGSLVLHGQVDGIVVASDSVRIVSTGRLCGRVYSVHLIIEEGGILEGESEPYSIPATAIDRNREFAGKR